MSGKISDKVKVRKQFIRDAKTECWYCGETEICCLEFHHLYGKDNNIGRFLNINKIKAEAAKCIVVCSNCHKKIHAGLYDSPTNNGYQIVYKVTNNRFYSQKETTYKLKYKFFKLIKPTAIPHSKIFICKTLEEARSIKYPYDKIIKCKASNVTGIKSISTHPSHDRSFWKNRRNRKRVRDGKYVMISGDTIYICDELIPLEEVQ